MNKDIQTLIEREACEHWSQSNYKEVAEKAHSGNDMCKTSAMARKVSNSSFQAGASFALSLFKWRKVEEEMPEERTDINIKSHGCIYSSRMVRIDDVPIFFISGVSLTVKLEDITEWMPIPQID